MFVTHDQDEALAMSDAIGVMNRGKLEQTGAPEEIYRNPLSAYVADFVGAANVLDAMLPAAAGAGAITGALLGDAPLRARAAAALSPGMVKLAARPEDIRLLALSDFTPGDVPAKITGRQYLGAHTHYTLRLAPGSVINVNHGGDGHGRFNAGDDAALRFDPLKTLLLPS